MRRSGTGAAALRHRVAFDVLSGIPDGRGGQTRTWSEEHVDRAELIYQRGSEAVQAARLEGRQVFKVRIRTSAAARALTTEHRMRDVERGLPDGLPGDVLPGNRFNIRDVDAVTDRGWVWLQVESGVAV